MKRIFIVLSMLLILTGTLAWASATSEQPAAAGAGRDIVELDYMYRYSRDLIPPPDNLWVEEMLKRFDLDINFEMVPSGEYISIMELRLAAGDEPDILFPWPKSTTDQWGMQGYLLPLQDLLDEMPNIRANFDDASWAYVMKAAPSPDGNIYSYPSPSSIYLANGWGYRDQVFDALGISFPSNTDELYEAAKRIKAEYPDSWPVQGWAKTKGYRSLTGGYLLAWRTWDDWFIDPDTNAVTYGPQTDKYREVMKFINKLYAEDLVFPEVDQKDFTKWSELLAEGRHHIMFFNVGRIGHVNSVVDPDDPTAQFKIVHDGVVTAPGLEPIVARGRPFGEGGSIATSATDEQVERWLEYTNFLASPEGGIFMYYGVEGVTFNWGTDESGERIPILMDHMATTANPQGQSMYEQGFVKGMYYPAEYALAATGQGGHDADAERAVRAPVPAQQQPHHLEPQLGRLRHAGRPGGRGPRRARRVRVEVPDGDPGPERRRRLERLPGRPGARRPGAGPRDPRHQQGGLRTVLGRYVTPTLRGHLPHRGRCPFRCSGEGDERRLTPSRRRTRT